MEESAPKRQRTSPRLSGERSDDINESTTPPDPPPQRSRIPVPRRPSFASPTRSSLARSNPDILRRRSLSPAKRAGDNATPPVQDNAAAGSASQDQTQSQDTERSFLERKPSRPRGSLFGPESTEPTVVSPARRGLPSSRPSGALASRPRRSSGKPNPRPLPEPGPEEEEINPFAGRVLKRTPPRTGVIPARPPPQEPEPEPEPELPPTPTQKGQPDPVVTTPPMGIHDTPSKRRRRNGSPSKSSPLKQPPLRPPEFTQNTMDPAKKKATAAASRERGPTKTARSTRAKKGPGGTHEARHIPEPDPHAVLKEERDALQAEIAKLEADLDFATEENDRVRRTQSLRSGAEPFIPDSRRDQLFDLLRRHLVPAEKEKPQDAAQEWFDLAMNPASWLSFASLGQTQPLVSKAEEEDLPAPVSHHPIQMSAVEELPYLQAFTPFEFSGTTSMLPREDDSEPLMRKHSIVVRSANPAGLFMAKIEMIVETEKLQIKSLGVPRLDPAAVPELGPFIEKIVKGGSNTHMKRNVSVATWAMAEWYRVAVERAHVWHVVESELGDREKLRASVARIRTRRKKRRRRDDEEQPSQEADEGSGDKLRADSLNRSVLLPHLGRTTYEIPIPDAVDEETSCLRIHWRIEFDWTGEAQSKVGLMIGMPGRWRQGDERGSLAAASKVFERLVSGSEGPMTAVRTVVALLAGDVPS
ncbi:hypothetical protein CPLU01_13978 [Colletotrichum plurivorum]|uniref:Uncharacterized protein n=1 Tax=Colletotrichum plurivorum TaxID=2175906 RepID=A0A8H6N0N1_9PEZI|nr:hypothetical protein CPLU01_13978 [Colletotrichum plurivorum]